MRHLRDQSESALRRWAYALIRWLKEHLSPRNVDRLKRLRALAREAKQARVRPPDPAQLRQAGLQEVEALPRNPTISLVMPTYKTDLPYLAEAVDSVREQYYPGWELHIVDDASGEPALTAALERHAAGDERIHFHPLAENRGISGATNEGLAHCEGEYVGFLDHDDTLTPDSLLRVAQVLAARPETDVVYSDSDKLDLHGKRADPFLKPDWSPVYALGAMYIGHLLVVRTELARGVGGFDSAFDKIQDFEFMLRVSERTEPGKIVHIPQVIYHWRAIPGSIAAGAEEKSGVPELQARAVSAHLERLGVPAEAVPHPTIPHRAVLAARDGGPSAKVSVIVPLERGAAPQRLLDSLRLLDPAPAEVLLVGLEDKAPAGTTVVAAPAGPFNRARGANAGARAASGDHLLFLEEAAEIVDPDTLTQFLLHAALPGVGAVGPMLVRPDRLVEAAGVAIGLEEPAMPLDPGIPAASDGYYGSLPCSHEVAALSAACLLVRRPAFDAAGGFNENYASQYDDYDLCRRLAANGERSVYAARPQVVTHLTPAARRQATDIVDRALFVDCWYDDLLAGDPYFNPAFSKRRGDHAPAGWRDRIYHASTPAGGGR
jgi:GT2 family glycosyltransferase